MKFTIALGLLSSALASEVTPVEKVITLLEEMQNKIVEEGKNEAATYDTFACFCKDTAKAKGASIDDLNTQIEGLDADLASQNNARDEADVEMRKQEGIIADLGEERAKLEADGRKRREKYGFEITDMTQAVEALEGAIDVLKASDKSDGGKAFMQIKDTLETASIMAESLNLRHSSALVQFMQDIPDVPVSDYDFHSNSIIDTLKELLKEFRKTKQNVDEAEVSAVQEETKLLQSNHDSTESAKLSFQDAKKASADADNEVGRISGDLTIATATLRDDQHYLVDLTDKCNKKKSLWDQRSTARTDELTALTQALVLLKGTVSEKTTEDTIRSNSDKKDTASFDEKIASFIQIKKVNPLRMLSVRSQLKNKSFLKSRSPREQLVDLLKAKSFTLKSAILASVASHAGADPLAKVKKLIEELVLRLQQEASDEEAHNGWCVKQTTLAEDKRETNAAKVEDLNAKLAKGEANRDKLMENIKKLTEEKDQLEKDLAKATEIREAEKKENENTVSDAKTGQEAVEKAIEILDRFYKTQANKVKSKKDFEQFLQQGPVADDIPEAGFDEEYGGNQDDNVGVLGMLDVIKSDFIRTIETTEATEKEQASDYLEFKTTTDSSVAEKTSSINQYDSELTEQKSEIAENTENMDSALEALDSAVQELIELHAACVDTGMSYEERVEQREKEIEALKEAYSILDNYKL